MGSNNYEGDIFQLMIFLVLFLARKVIVCSLLFVKVFFFLFFLSGEYLHLIAEAAADALARCDENSPVHVCSYLASSPTVKCFLSI